MPRHPFHYAVHHLDTTTEWPAADSPAWIKYDSVLERKRACNDWKAIPVGCRQLLSRMMTLPVADMLDSLDLLIPDATLHGAGCHEMTTGDYLDLHLDCDRHPVLGWQRRANSILFLDDWNWNWNGRLEFYEPGFSHPAVSILPSAGKLVLFATHDKSLHRVSPLTCPVGQLRRTLVVNWWSESEGPGQRPRALFLPLPGEQPDLEKDKLRRLRAGVQSGLVSCTRGIMSPAGGQTGLGIGSLITIGEGS